MAGVTFASWMEQMLPDFLRAVDPELADVALGIMDGLQELSDRIDGFFRQLRFDKASKEFLPIHADMRNLNVVSTERPEQLRAQVGRAWDVAVQSATDPEMVAQVMRLGYQKVRVVDYNMLFRAGHPNAFGKFGSFWFLVIEWPVGDKFVQADAYWGGGADWGGPNEITWGGSGLKADDIEEIRQVIYHYKPAHTSCRYILVALDATAVLNPDFTLSGPWVSYPVNEPWEFDFFGVAKPFYNDTYERP